MQNQVVSWVVKTARFAEVSEMSVVSFLVIGLNVVVATHPNQYLLKHTYRTLLMWVYFLTG